MFSVSWKFYSATLLQTLMFTHLRCEDTSIGTVNCGLRVIVDPSGQEEMDGWIRWETRGNIYPPFHDVSRSMEPPYIAARYREGLWMDFGHVRLV